MVLAALETRIISRNSHPAASMMSLCEMKGKNRIMRTSLTWYVNSINDLLSESRENKGFKINNEKSVSLRLWAFSKFSVWVIMSRKMICQTSIVIQSMTNRCQRLSYDAFRWKLCIGDFFLFIFAACGNAAPDSSAAVLLAVAIRSRVGASRRWGRQVTTNFHFVG